MDSNVQNYIGLKSISELLELNFFIPDYQRGYRWTERQITELLNDINEFTKNNYNSQFYCLQPLVVHRMNKAEKEKYSLPLDKTWYEVIDGQQRLTTIRLILKHNFDVINLLGLPSALYTIEYARKNNKLDNHYISEAERIIEKWHKENRIDKADFNRVLLKHEPETIENNVFVDKAKNVRLIWYESVNDDPISVFTRLNIGKIALTNAELIKALFLNSSNFPNDNSRFLRQREISSEWDNIEQTLQNPEFWYFLNRESEPPATRIDFIFKHICDKNIFELAADQFKVIGYDEYRTFRYFYEISISDGSKFISRWKTVKHFFQTFNDWYRDFELYHYIGYAIDQAKWVRDCSISDLISQWKYAADKNDFKNWIRGKIYDSLKDFALEKEYVNKRDCLRVLLFHNIQTSINLNKEIRNGIKGIFYRFPFHLYKTENWDVEHINSYTENDESDAKTRNEWLLNTYLCVDYNTKKDIESGFRSKSEVEVYTKVKAKYKFENDDWEPKEKNMIWNYVLLDSSTNRSYGNAIFPCKRRIIIGKEQGIRVALPMLVDGRIEIQDNEPAESSFVPPCTKHVFLKYYSPTDTQTNYWTKEIDAAAYKADIERCIKQIKPKYNNEQDTNDEL